MPDNSVPLPPVFLFLLIFLSFSPRRSQGIGTFKGPFTISGNGYFAGWIAFAASLKYAYGSNEVVRGFADRAADAMKVWNSLPPSFPRIAYYGIDY